jgi:hypothetical protein
MIAFIISIFYASFISGSLTYILYEQFNLIHHQGELIRQYEQDRIRNE